MNRATAYRKITKIISKTLDKNPSPFPKFTRTLQQWLGVVQFPDLSSPPQGLPPSALRRHSPPQPA